MKILEDVIKKLFTTHDNHKSSILSPFAVQAVNLQVLDVVDFLQPLHIVLDQVVGGDMHRPVRLEHVPELDQAVLWNLNQFVLGVCVLTVRVRHL